MANQYQSTNAKSNAKSPATHNGMNLIEWLMIVAVLIAATVGYAYYNSYKNANRPAPNQPVATDNMSGTASNVTPTQPTP